ncbi:MAG TPA: SusC/RagA family TonB-linked outer membrane protein [Chitinophagaceae bacterium]|nr:SusC/RagA family TonB-linked outer membrane protein [Chitinophagaceae bacterium]
MRLTAILLTVACIQVAAKGNSQTVTIDVKNARIQQVLNEVSRQTGVSIAYNDALFAGVPPVSIKLKNASVQQVFEKLFKDLPFEYRLENNSVSISKKNIPAEVKSDLPPPLITVKGRVVDEEGNAVPGATVAVKGSRNATATDGNGNYTLNSVDEHAVLMISGANIETYEVNVNSQVTINATVRLSVKVSEEIVVAYNKTTAQKNVSALTVVKGDQIQNLPNRSFDKSLEGLVPGLLVNSGSGQPGGATNNFVLRGIATGGVPDAGQSYRNPLIVIDGVPVYQDPLKINASGDASESNPLAQLNPSDIENITILKDAAAIGLYGSKASNGVILVTTRSGKAGKTSFSFRHQTDISERLKDPAVLNQDEYLELLFEAYKNSLPGITDAQILADLRSSPASQLGSSVYFPVIVKAPGDTSFYPAPDWNKEFYRNAAVTISNQLSVSGGNDKSNFYLNLEYTKQDGIIKETGFDRKSFRFNYENRVTSWLKFGINTTGSYTVQDYSPGSANIQAISPLLPIRLLNGNYMDNYSWGLGSSGGSYLPNPVSAAQYNIRRNVGYHTLDKMFGELKFLRHFTLSSSVGVDFVINENKEKVHPRFVLLGESVPGNGSVQDQTVRNAILLTTNILRYERIFNAVHSVNLLFGQEAQVLSNKYTLVELRGFGANPTATEPFGGGTLYAGRSNVDKQTLLSYFGQANYGYKDKYYLSGSIRRDGSSRFGDNNRFGTYWSLGGGWMISNEPFFKRVHHWIDNFKLRGSLGAAGNSAAISGLLRYDQIQILTYLGNTVVIPNRSNSPGNPSIQWEQTFNWNAGVETRFWKGRISFTADKYSRKTNDLIAYGILLPSTSGFSSITGNIGDVKNEGIELSLSIDLIRRGDFQWKIGGNWSANKSKLTRASVPLIAIANNLVNKVGEEFNSFYLRRWAGVNPDNGRPQWVDSATGKPTENYNAAKPEIVGKAQPDGFGAFNTGISYKGFEISGMLYYQYGFQIYLVNTLQNDGLNPYVNQTKDALDRWQKPGDIAANPRRLLSGRIGTLPDLGTNPSTRYLYDGDFIRFSNVSLAYSFPKKIMDRLHVSLLKIFLQGHNLATWTKYSGQDPENVSAQHRAGAYLYPQQRTYSLGLNVNF